ncbi:Oidioi.mRNA.OKI2018_I69.chr1.g2641.t1.cds [Oikopleura dioica]|uniref:Oidioi.mRNA.OKI2018_I69.chr1.g2641.t1.cds n=1 Tax=Oikopleura dioica TaxID=34765 RepID=A0ABN7SV90_OIKDI|nr:Oidioi.mRNA.OKI2018_I69.chr1.g2641.t1.cds [Oikopleura dioica]
MTLEDKMQLKGVLYIFGGYPSNLKILQLESGCTFRKLPTSLPLPFESYYGSTESIRDKVFLCFGGGGSTRNCATWDGSRATVLEAETHETLDSGTLSRFKLNTVKGGSYSSSTTTEILQANSWYQFETSSHPVGHEDG